MQFVCRAPGKPSKLAILSGAFHPPTRAHLSLARTALNHADEVLFVLPGRFPHKEYEGATLAQRIEMLSFAVAGEGRFSIGVTEGGLFIEIARECREVYGSDVALAFLCGRDAAERIVNWDYGEPNAIEGMLEVFELLVAPRGGEYQPPAHLRKRVTILTPKEDLDYISATEVREKIQRGEPWEELVPESIVPLVRKYYG